MRGQMRWIAAAAAGAMIAGCAASPEQGPGAGQPAVAPAPGRINHVVFFKLQDSAQADALVTDSLALGQIPGVTACYAGRHLDTGRTTVLSDYDVGFFVAFDSEEDYAAYVAHPDHIALVDKWRPRLTWLKVYDVLDARAGSP